MPTRTATASATTSSPSARCVRGGCGSWGGRRPPGGSTGGAGQGTACGAPVAPAGCCPRGGEQRAGHRPPRPAEPPGEPRTGTSPFPGKGHGERAGLPGRGTPGRAAGTPREDAPPGVGTGSPGCGMSPGVRIGGCAPPRAVQGGTPGEDATPSVSRHPCPQPRSGGVPWSPPVPALPCPVDSPRPRSRATWADPWSRTLSGLGASLAASPVWGSAPHPKIPWGGILGGLGPLCQQEGLWGWPPGLGVPLHPKDVALGDLGEHQRSALAPLRVCPLSPSFGVGETPKLIKQPWRDPTSPGVPDPSLGTSGCASGCPPGTRCTLSREPRGVGTTLLPWPRARRSPAASPGRSQAVSVCPSLGSVPALLWGPCPARDGDAAVLRRDPRAGRCRGVQRAGVRASSHCPAQP